MLSPIKRNYYLPLIILFFTVSSNISACQKTDSLTSAKSFQDDDTLVSEFHQFLKLKTDMGWFKQYVTITYKNKIENFNVRILWLPTDNPAPFHKISGPGIIEFTDPIKSTRFTIELVDLVFTPERMGIDSLEQRWYLLDRTINLDFEDPEIKDRITVGSITEPFFFYDVDFNNNVELLITEVAGGQQLSNTYKVYKLNASGLVNDSNQTTNLKPFSLLNDFTEFNKMDKTISIGSSFGGGNMQTSIYKKINPSEFKLISIVKCTFEEKITFELVDGEMVEIDRRKNKNQ